MLVADAEPEVDGSPEWLRRYGQELLTLEEVGKLEGVTREAIRHRLRALGITPRTMAETNELRRLRAVSGSSAEILDAFYRLRDIQEVAHEVELKRAWVHKYIRDTVPDYAVLTRVPRMGLKRYSQEELKQCLRDAAGSAGDLLSAEAYQRHVGANPYLVDGRARPGKQAMALRFGSWRAALAAAGLPSHPHSGPDKTFDEASAVAAVIACWRALGFPPSSATYDVWQRQHAQHPSAATVRNLCGSWNTLLLRAWQVVYGLRLEQEYPELAVPESILQEVEADSTSSGLLPYVVANEGAEIELPHYFADEYAGSERAVRGHAVVQNAVAKGAEDLGFKCLSPVRSGPQFDVAVVSNTIAYIVEVKSANRENIEHQMRIAVGQVLKYCHDIKPLLGLAKPVIAVQISPGSEWVSTLRDLGIGLLVLESMSQDLRLVLRTEEAQLAP
jgi:hypothetical protein